MEQKSATKRFNFVNRPGYGTRGRQIQIYANSYPVTSFPTSTVIQYDVNIGDGTARRALIKKVWGCNQLKAHIGPQNWEAVLFDGNKLAWSHKPLPFGNELNVQIDLSQEPQFGKKKADIIRVVIKRTTTIVLEPVHQWINGRMENNPDVQAGITFLNHLVSQSLRLDPDNVCLKRSFFRKGCEERPLPGGLVVKKGLFLSVRGGLNKLYINVDVATSVFWPAANLLSVMMGLFPGNTSNAEAFASTLAKTWGSTGTQAHLKKLRRIQIYTKHSAQGRPDKDQKRYMIDGWTEGDARTTVFPRRVTNNDGTVTEKTISVADYFQQVYNIRLKYPNLRLVRTKKAGNIPIELCFVDSGNRYSPKLDDRQTSDMIKFTATRPEERRNALTQNVNACRWASDTVLAKYGMKIDPRMLQTNARILPAPTIQYAGAGRDATVMAPQGNWNLQGKRFALTKELKFFGLCIFGRQSDLPIPQASNFLRSLAQSYVGHGGRLTNPGQPLIQYASNPETGAAVREFAVAVKKQCGGVIPQVLFFVVPTKSSSPYNEIKQMCDIQLGVVSQCVLVKHAQRPAPQYLSNVCMKLNAKLGGTTCYLQERDNPFIKKGKTMFIGADVSHAAPGLSRPSFASMVGSLDLHGTRYGAICNTNGIRTEMITPANMQTFVRQMLKNFRGSTGDIPERIFYFRDGVSEQQYHHVIQEEVAEMKKLFNSMPINGRPFTPKLTVVICSKRHHHRFFPANKQDADRNGNVLPGTLIERDITDPAEFDFYLNSHKAIQGTARATHYYVIYDENKFTVDELQAMCYNMCYTYIRSTTSVSLIPPVYYAHLASQRARAHEHPDTSQTGTYKSDSTPSGGHPPVKPLMPLRPSLVDQMWFV